MIQTITPLSICLAIFRAVVTEPPLLMPENTPSSLARRMLIALASSSLTSIILSTLDLSNILGKYASGYFLIPGILELSVGWAPIISISGFISFKKVETPIIVPVVPIADTKCVTS